MGWKRYNGTRGRIIGMREFSASAPGAFGDGEDGFYCRKHCLPGRRNVVKS